MFAAIRRYEINPASVSVKDLIRRIEAEFVPMVSRSPGFISYHVIDAGNGVVATIGMFESEARAQESTQQTPSWIWEYGRLESSVANLVQYKP
jgi:hypothetical protein